MEELNKNWNGHVHYSIFSFSEKEKGLSDLIPFISHDEIKRANEFAFEYLKNKFLICRGTLRVVLAQALDCHPKNILFTYSEYDKPELKFPNNPNLSFNVSHAADLFTIAIAWNSVIGIDVEYIDRRIELFDVASEVFTPDEISHITKLEEKERYFEFYRKWTIKESYIKCIGKGFSFDPKYIEISEEDKTFQNPETKSKADYKLFQFHQYFLNLNYSFALVNQKKTISR